jgi:isopentenyldiphosphate isomerase
MSDPTIAQDPRELFDVVTYDGRPTGRTKRRADVHRDGDWHRAVHVWVAGIDDGGPFLTFQRRSLAKDTWPGRLDATVGGHFRAGEGLVETLREVEEEIGIAVGMDELRVLGKRICINEGEPGVVDHELQDVFLLRDDRPLTRYRPSPAELAALVRCPLSALLDLFADRRETIHTIEVTPGSLVAKAGTARRDDFIPQFDRYFYRVAIAAERFLAEERHIAV